MMNEHRGLRRHGLFERATALVLSWVFTASTVWAAAPPVLLASGASPAPARGSAVSVLPVASSLQAMRSPLATVAGQARTAPSSHSGRVHGQPRGGAIEPRCDCVQDNKDGTFTAFFGYRNDNGHEIALRPDVDSHFLGDHRHDARCQHGSTFHPGDSRDWKHSLGVVFHGPEVWWVVKGPDGNERRVKATHESPRCGHKPPSPSGDCTGFFGPKKYLRTTGPKNVYTETIAIPATVKSPYTLRVQNGETNGSNRVSSAWVALDGVDVIVPSDLNPNVGLIERTVTLTPPTTTLKVTLASKPGSYLTINLCGTSQQPSGDATPPTVTWAAPTAGAITNDATPMLRVQYVDTPGAGETTASGVDLTTLKVFVDDVDQTVLFTKRTDEASAQLPDTLALSDGAHHLLAQIKDLAGNNADARIDFRVDTKAPTIAIAQPLAGALLRTLTPPVQVSYQDDAELDLAKLSVAIDATDVTGLMTKGAGEAAGTVSLAEGGHTMTATIRDRAGNLGTAVPSPFRVDVTKPTLTLSQPACGSAVGSATPAVVVTYSDASGIDLASLNVTVDGAPVAMTAAADQATGQTATLARGLHTLAARVRDGAGNEAVAPLPAATCSFRVDTDLPHINIALPEAGSFTNAAAVPVEVDYWDDDGIDRSTLHIFVGGAERTSDFVIGPTQASATIAGLRNGGIAVEASVKDWAGKSASASSSFTIDKLAPTVAVALPEALVSVKSPASRVVYNGTGTDIVLSKAEIWLDGTNVTSLFALSGSEAVGTLPELSDGKHTLSAVVFDQATNRAETTPPYEFRVDTTPPTASFTVPPSFTKDRTPDIRLAYADENGSGVDAAKVRVWLSSGAIPPGDEPPAEREITPLCVRDAAETICALPEDQGLADEPQRLRGEVSDLAGNIRAVNAAFEVDTVAPTYEVKAPVAETFISTSTPSLLVTYQDGRSGVDPQSVTVVVGGVDRTEHLLREETQASGTIPPAEALSDGRHDVAVTLKDRAGNEALPVPHAFVVDTKPPKVIIETPVDGSRPGKGQVPVAIRATYSDEDSGAGNAVVTSSVQVLIDGVNRASELSVGPAVVEGALPLPDGLHNIVVRVEDRAHNQGFAGPAGFVVDTVPPDVTDTFPPENDYINAAERNPDGTVHVTGHIQDADSAVSVTCSAGGKSVAGTISGNSFACDVPVVDGANQVHIEARDSAGNVNTTEEPLDLFVDVNSPQVVITGPVNGSYTNADTLPVSVAVRDASPVTVAVNGRPAGCVEGPPLPEQGLRQWSCVANDVPITGPIQTFEVAATDAAGNPPGHSDPVSVIVDRDKPRLSITSPTSSACLAEGMIDVAGHAEDDTSPISRVTVNDVVATGCSGSAKQCDFVARVSVTGAAVMLTAVAKDMAGNVSEPPARVDVKPELNPPGIRITLPQPGTVTNGVTVHVEGSITDESKVTATIGLADGDQAPLPVNPDGTFASDLALPGGEVERPLVIVVGAADCAHLPVYATVPITLDRKAPAVKIYTPKDGAAIREQSVVVGGTVDDPQAGVKVATTAVPGSVDAVVTGNAWTATVVTLGAGANRIMATATDAVGNSSSDSISITVELGPPTVAIGSPTSGLIVTDPLIEVKGTVTGATVRDVTVKGRVATITGTPAGQDSSGRDYYNCAAGCGFSASGVLLDPGSNSVTATATDTRGNTGSASVSLIYDAAPPVVVLTAPESMSRSRSETAEATVTDDVGVADVVFVWNSGPATTFTAPPYTVDLVAPADAKAGDTLTLVVTARDVAGHTATVSRGVRVAAEGVVVGQTLDDRTSLPLAGASAQLVSPSPCTGSCTAASDATGRYSLPVSATQAVVRIEAPNSTFAERAVAVALGVGTVPVDVRLTSLAAAKTIGADGGAVTASAVHVGQGPVEIALAVPAGAVASETGFGLTALSAQGLPGLLPLGWSSVAAFDLRLSSASGGTAPTLGSPIPASLTLPCLQTSADTGACTARWAPPVSGLHLIEYRQSSHAWHVVARADAIESGKAALSLPWPGVYALVVADSGDPAPAIPAVGDPLLGVAFAVVPTAATSTGSVDPSVVPPSGGTARGSLTVASPSALPSGTIVQAEVTETYDLVTQQTASREKRRMDIVLQRGACACTADGCAASTLCAQVPVTPAMTFQNAELVQGRVHLDILSGREGVRGLTGGNAPVVVRVPGMETSLSVPAGALPEETAIQVEQASERSSFVFASDQIVPLAEVVIDFAGKTLQTAAQLRISGQNAVEGDTFLIVKVERASGVPQLVAASQGGLINDAEGLRIVSLDGSGLPGIVEGGRYVVYRIAASQPIGFASGSATSGGASAAALVRVSAPAGWPFVAMSRPQSGFVLVAPAGAVDLRATVPGTALVGTASATVPENARVEGVLIALTGTTTTATVAPANDTVNVALSAPIEITASAAIDPASATNATIRLFKGEDEGGTPVALRFVLSSGGRQLSVIPYTPAPDPPTDAALPAPLEFSTRYTLLVSGLTDVYGAPIVLPPTRFRTKDDVAPYYDPNNLTFTYSADERVVHVTAPGCFVQGTPNGCFYPGSEVLIVDASNGIVTWLQAGNKGEVDDFFPATLDDVLIVTISDPFGHSTTFTRSQYAIQGSSETAIGVGGGVVRGEGGIELRIPEGALDKAVRFTIEPVGQDYFPTQPPMNWDGTGQPPAHFGAGLMVKASEAVKWKKEAKLAFPLPDFSSLPPDQRPAQPEDAFYYVFAKNQGSCPLNAETCEAVKRPVLGYQTIDYAKVEHSPDGQARVVTASYPFEGFMDPISMSYSIVEMMFSMIMSEVATPLGGAITGRVTRARADGKGYEGLAQRKVWVSKDAGVVRGPDEMTANTDNDGNFTITDFRFYMGNYEVSTKEDDGKIYAAQAYANANMKNDPGWMMLARVGYKNVAVANITLPPPPPTEPAPAIAIKLFTVQEQPPVGEGETQPPPKRIPVDGYVITGVPLLITFTSSNADNQIAGVRIDGQAQPYKVDPLDTTGRTMMLSAPFVPSGLGTHTVEATVLPAFGPAVTERTVFRVLGSAGAEIDPVPGAPRVIDSRSLPKEGAENVPVTATLVVAFSEPVKNVPGNVRLIVGEDELPIIVTGIDNHGKVVKAGDMTSASVVTSLTIEPAWGLYFGQKHELRLGSAIVDLDEPLAQSLEPYVLTFTTFEPQSLDGTDTLKRQADVVVLGDRAYIAEVTAWGLGMGDGILRSYDISNPARPEEIGQGASILFPPWAMSGEEREGAKRLAVACGARKPPAGAGTAGNVLFYDIVPDGWSEKPVWRGGVSVAENVVDGTARRVVLKDGMAYVATIRKGLQVINADAIVSEFPTDTEGQNKAYREMCTQPGYRNADVVTIPFKDGLNPVYTFLTDLAVEDIVTGADEARMSQRLIFATGNALSGDAAQKAKLGLMIANPQTMEVLYQKRIFYTFDGPDLGATTTVDLPSPETIAIARVGARFFALVAGYGTYASSQEAAGAGSLLVAIEVTDPRVPVFSAAVSLQPSGLQPGLPKGVGEVNVAPDGTIIVSGGPEGGSEGKGPAVLVGGLASLATTQPHLFVAGTIYGVGSRIALSKNGNIYSTEESFIKGETTLGGMRAARLDPRCILLDVLTPRVKRAGVIDVLNGQFCGGTSPLVFNLCREARVSLNIEGHDVSGMLDGEPRNNFSDVVLAKGSHQFVFDKITMDSRVGVDGERQFLMHAQSVEESDDVVDRAGKVASSIENRSVLPVGHTFVKGVDLLDGHVVRGGTDIKMRGRNIGLEVTRTYSSTSKKRHGLLGGNWEWNLASRVIPSTCATTVITMDGSSQQFQSSDGGRTFTPQKGYHTKLELKDGKYIFTDKAGVEHHFKTFATQEILGDVQLEYPLDFVREPHGDELRWVYDNQNRIVEVDEWQKDGNIARKLMIGYTTVDGYPRVGAISVEGLGTGVSYTYDNLGNLTDLVRSANGTPSVIGREHFEYSKADPTDPHKLILAKDVNGAITEYEYYKDSDQLPGEGIDWLTHGVFIVGGKHELAKSVREHPGHGMTDVETKFTYERSQGLSGRFTTVVKDGRGNDTTYVLNGNGSPLEIQEPEGRTTKMVWHDDDIYKDSEEDANHRLTEYKYDDRANLTNEIIHTDDFGPVETVYAYDTKYNKLKYKKDAEGHETFYDIDPANGDVLFVTDAVGNVTGHQYDHGRLKVTTDPRKSTITYSDFNDTYGNAWSVTGPGDYTATRTYDQWGRLQTETDSRGHSTATTYDGLDRISSLTRQGGLNSQPYAKTTDYYPGGQVKKEQIQHGLYTEYGLDGMNRVISARTVYNSPKEFTIITTYDRNGNKSDENDARGVQRHFTYDGVNRLTQVDIVGGPAANPTGPITEYHYDAVGNKDWERDLRSNLQTDFVYDGLYRVKTKTYPAVAGLNGGSTRYSEETHFDKVGNRRYFRDANGNETSYTPDGLGRVVSTTNALNQTSTTYYNDPEGSHVNKSMEYDQARGLRTSYVYDPQGRELTRTVTLEGAGGDGAVYVTNTSYTGTHVHIEGPGPNGHITDQELNGRDHVAQETVHTSDGDLVTKTTYDQEDRPYVVTNPRGIFTMYGRDGYGRVISTYDSRYTATADYDGTGLKLMEKDRRGVVRNYVYDNIGRLLHTWIEPSITGVNWRQDTDYDDPALKRTETVNGQPTVHQLDAMGRVLSSKDALGKFVYYTYDGVNKRSQSDKRGNVTRFDYDKINRLTVTTDPAPFDGQTVVVTYDNPQNQRIEKDRKGYLTATQLDPLGRVRTVTRQGLDIAPPVVVERNDYDAYGNKMAAEDGEGHRTAFQYDGANRLKVRTDGAGSDVAADTTFTYQESGGTVLEKDQRASDAGQSYSIQRRYDYQNRLQYVIDGLMHSTYYDYDQEGNRILVREPGTQHTDFKYDELGKLILVTQPAADYAQPAPLTRYEYDANRNRTWQYDGNEHAVYMVYDDLNRLTKTIQDPSGLALATEITEYDPDGNVLTLKDAKGQIITSTYDELKRVKTKSYAFAAGDPYRPWRYLSSVAYDYDANSNLKRVDEVWASSGSDPPARTTHRVYDGFNRLQQERVEEAGAPDGPVNYTYWKNGTRKTVETGGLTTRYEYDGRSRLHTATTGFGSADPRITTYFYWPDDLLKEIRYPNGLSAVHSYYADDRLKTLVNQRGSTVVSSYAYTYDSNGNRLGQAEVNGGRTENTAYSYDWLNRLKTITYPADSQYPTGRLVTYGYDLVGNRIGEVVTDHATVGGTVATLSNKVAVFDNVNRLRTVTDSVDPAQNAVFDYDANGNEIAKTVAGVRTDYGYDVRDKQVEAWQGASVLGRYQFDFDGRRTLKLGETGITSADNLRRYVYDQTSILAEYNADSALVSKYDYGSDRLISLTSAYEGRRYYLFDGLRSVTNLTNDSGATAASYHLDAWGNFRNPDELNASQNRFAFTGYQWDIATGLYNAKARFYDPLYGRFMSQDSFLGKIDNPPSIHRYFYANDNPTRYIDLTGHAGQKIEYKGTYGDVLMKDIVPDVPHFAETVNVNSSDDGDRATALSMDLGHRMAGFNNAANDTARGAGIVAMGVGAVVSAPVCPLCSGYLVLRAGDEGQAFAREKITGKATESEAQQGMREMARWVSKDERDANLIGSVALTALDVSVGGLGARRAGGGRPSGDLSGIIRESRTGVAVEPPPTSEPGLTRPNSRETMAHQRITRRGAAAQQTTAVGETADMGLLKPMTRAQIQQMAIDRGYSSVPAASGGTVWTRPMPDGETAAVRTDPPKARPASQSNWADTVKHAHKETVGSGDVHDGNYKPQDATTYDDQGNVATDKQRTHIQHQ
jgi:RHS repeat-associated protein